MNGPWCIRLRAVVPNKAHFLLPLGILLTVVFLPMVALALDLNPSFTPEAVAKYREKADAGDAEAQYLYSEALAKGKGVAENRAKSVEYAQKAADQGYGLAFRLVGEGYENGWGVASNSTEAEKWYDKFLTWAKPEAEKGNAHAQLHLGRYYFRGIKFNKRRNGGLLMPNLRLVNAIGRALACREIESRRRSCS